MSGVKSQRTNRLHRRDIKMEGVEKREQVGDNGKGPLQDITRSGQIRRSYKDERTNGKGFRNSRRNSTVQSDIRCEHQKQEKEANTAIRRETFTRYTGMESTTNEGLKLTGKT